MVDEASLPGAVGSRAWRRELAKQLAADVRTRYGDDVTGIAIYGSAANGTDTSHSDLEMVAVTTTAVEEHSVEYVHAPTEQKVEIDYVPEGEFLRRARTVTPMWTIVAPAYYRQLVLYQRGDVFARSRAALRALGDEQFREAQARIMREYLSEEIGKVRNARERRDEEGLLWAARDLVWHSVRCLALANRTYFSSAQAIWEEARRFPVLPERFSECLAILWGTAPATGGEVAGAAEALWEGVRAIVEGQGVAWTEPRWMV